MDSTNSDDDSWSTLDSSLCEDSDAECSTCSTSNDSDCSFKWPREEGECAAPHRRPSFARGERFVVKDRADDDLEDSFLRYNEEDGEVEVVPLDSCDSDDCSSSSCSSGSEEEEAAEEEWFPAPPAARARLPFTATPALRSGQANTPLDFFHLLFNRDFAQFLADIINARGAEIALKKKKTFIPTDVEEVYTLLCTHFMMGYTICVSDDILWGRRPSLNVDFNTYMRKGRYFLLFNLLMYRNVKNKSREDYRSWYAVAKPIADKFNGIMREVMVPGKNLHINKETVLFFDENRNLMVKPQRIRMHMLADDHGIFQRVFLVDPDLQMEVRGETILSTLMEDFFHSGRSVFTPNMYYTSVSLAEDFLERKTYLTGLLKKNRPRSPRFLKLKPQSTNLPIRMHKVLSDKKYFMHPIAPPLLPVKKPKEMEKEAMIIQGFNKKGVCVCKMIRENNKFNLLSTEFDARPAVDRQWECSMLEQTFLHTHTARRDAQLAKCGPRLARRNNRHVAHILQTLCLNAYLMYKAKTGRKLKFVKFLEEILYQMLPLEVVDEEKGKASGQKKKPKRNCPRRQRLDDCIVH